MQSAWGRTEKLDPGCVADRRLAQAESLRYPGPRRCRDRLYNKQRPNLRLDWPLLITVD